MFTLWSLSQEAASWGSFTLITHPITNFQQNEPVIEDLSHEFNKRRKGDVITTSMYLMLHNMSYVYLCSTSIFKNAMFDTIEKIQCVTKRRSWCSRLTNHMLSISLLGFYVQITVSGLWFKFLMHIVLFTYVYITVIYEVFCDGLRIVMTLCDQKKGMLSM